MSNDGGFDEADEIATARLGPRSQWSPVASEPSSSHAQPVESESRPIDVQVTAAIDEQRGFAARYTLGEILGRGGVGEVRLCDDVRIGRSVAMKLLAPEHRESPDVIWSFVREARVQGQLEHPAVPAVHDLGRAPDGAAYFTMRHVRGESLRDVIRALRRNEPEVAARWSRRKLLTAFSSVCLTVHYAHRRGVLHRDLKPSNVMLGEFGEVTVLDWGAASVRGEPDGRVMMGTPGYMPPEQVRGETIDERADVYALGALLFELLALRPLHTRRSVEDAIVSTISTTPVAPSVRAPDRDVAPELDAICLRAIAPNRDDRFASAGALCAAVERYLDGDRDLETRRRAAAEHARAAEESCRRALASTSDSADTIDERRRAMREAARALALWPDDPSAGRTMARLMLEPPRVLPPEARAEMERFSEESARAASRTGAVTYLSFLVLIPLTIWMGVKNEASALTTVALIALAAAAAFQAGRMRRHRATGALLALGASTLAISSVASILGPYLLLPAIAGVNTMGYAMQMPRARRPLVIALGTLALLVPIGLEQLGVLPAAYAFRDGVLAVLPRMHELPERPTLVFLFVTSLATIIVPSIYGGRVRDALARAEERLQLQAWHLRQIVSDPPREP